MTRRALPSIALLATGVLALAAGTDLPARFAAHVPLADLGPALIVAGAASAVAFVAGAVAHAGRSLSDHVLHLLLGATAGLLVTVAFVEMIPEAVEGQPGAGWIVAVVFLGLVGLELLMGGHEAHGHGHGHGEATPVVGRRDRAAHVGLAALSFHRLIGGLTLPAAFGVDHATGIGVAGAVLIHQVPDGLAAAALFSAAGWSDRRVLLSLAVVAIWVPVGAVVGIGVSLGGWFPILVAVSAATFLFVGAVELIPELHHGPHPGWVGAGVVVGVAAVALMALTTGHA